MSILSERLAQYDLPQKAMAAGVYPYFRPISSDQDSVVTINGKRVLMFGSNSYLGLTNHPKIKEGAINATKKYGTGCAGSRFLNGTLDIHLELEEKLARLVGKEEAMVYATGFTVNSGVIPCLGGREDYLLIDKLDHASIIEGSRLTMAQVRKYKHNDMESLEKFLQACAPDKIKVIVADGVFSMEGDVAKLPEIVELAKKYNASVMIDEAHSLGFFGEHGAGICEHFGLTDDVELIMGTFSKSLATIGGFVASNHDVINYLRHNSRTFIFSASITPQAAGAVLAALDVMKEETWRPKQLWANTHRMLEEFRENGFDIGHTTTPMTAIIAPTFPSQLLHIRSTAIAGVTFVNSPFIIIPSVMALFRPSGPPKYAMAALAQIMATMPSAIMAP